MGTSCGPALDATCSPFGAQIYPLSCLHVHLDGNVEQDFTCLQSCLCKSWRSSTTNGLKNPYAQLLENRRVGEVPNWLSGPWRHRLWMVTALDALLTPGSAASPFSMSVTVLLRCSYYRHCTALLPLLTHPTTSPAFMLKSCPSSRSNSSPTLLRSYTIAFNFFPPFFMFTYS